MVSLVCSKNPVKDFFSVGSFLLVGSPWCKNPVKDFCYGDLKWCLVSVCLVSGVWCAVVNGSLDLAARAIVLQAFLFDEAKIGAAKKFALQRQMNRVRDGRVLERRRVAEHCGLFVSTSCSINRFRVLARLARS